MGKRAKTGAVGGTVIVMTATDSRRRAAAMARRAVRERLAACVQTFPVTSTYRWKGRFETAKEFLLLMKTQAARSAMLVDSIRRWHTYELPEILVVPVQGGLEGYIAWIRRLTSLKA